ncbi:hypothetical protein [Pseudonocardia sp. ICBG601]|uniref:hypothetical protein n=1 Tax=Pseudonocardia sp. ICBG601 TaxID=2846759 RepID=UPI0035ABB2F9
MGGLRVGGDRGVGEHRDDPVRVQRERHVGLCLQLGDLDGRLALVGALLGAGLHVLDLHGALLDADRLAAEVVRVDPVRVALAGRQAGARGEVADHVQDLGALGVDW